MKTILLLVALGLIACGGSSEPVDRPAGGPLVTYDHGGGYASEPRHLVVRRDGRARLTIRSGTKMSRHRFHLTPGQLRDLEAVLADARGDKKPAVAGGCSDCFTYSIRADGIDVDLDQVSLEDASDALRRAVASLERFSS